MKVLLVFPPQWTPFRPYLSLPSLTAYLQEKGVTVVQKDFNLEAYDIMLTRPYLTKISEQLNKQFAALELKDQLTPGIEQKFYSDLFMAKSIVPDLADKVETAKGVYRDSANFFDPDNLESATNIINQALVAISLAHFPTIIGLSTFEMPSFTGSYDSLKSATQNRLGNPYIELFEEHLLPFINHERPDVIGITVSGESQVIPAFTLCKLLKQKGIKAHIAVGGYVISMLADVIVKYPELFEQFFDSAIINDGEKPLAELVRHLEQRKNLETVPNLIFRNGNTISVNAKETPENINSLPAPSFEGLPLDKYFSPSPVLPLLSSRGCYWAKCAFCTHSLAYGLNYQLRDHIKVVDDIEALSTKYGATHIALSDEGTSPASIGKISDEIIKRGIKIRLSTSIRPERQFTKELTQKMSAAGFKEVYIGVESSCDRVLKQINKGTEIESNEEILRNLHDAGIWDHVYIMFGFPGETIDEARQTYSFIEKHLDIICSLGISNFSVGRNSMVMRHPEKYGLELVRNGEESDFKLYFDHSVTSGISATEAWDMTRNCLDTVSTKLAGDVLLEKIGHHHDKGCILPQYLSHYEATDPSLHSIVKIKKADLRSHRTITLKMKPILKPKITRDQLKFNIRQIRQNIAGCVVDTADPEPTFTLFDPDHCRFKRITEPASEILTLCDGHRTVSEVAKILSLRFGVATSVIEKDCINLLQPIYDEGYLSLVSYP